MRPSPAPITDVLMPTSGVVVRKGQPLFKVTPDEIVVEEDPEGEGGAHSGPTPKVLSEEVAHMIVVQVEVIVEPGSAARSSTP